MFFLDFSCCNEANEYGIQSGVTWGSASKPVKDKWIKKSVT